MKVLAWIVLGGNAFLLAFYPVIWGKPREPARYGPQTWVFSVIEAALILPICGRILGWW